MSAGYLELFVEQGEDFSINVNLTALNGEPYNLTNSTIKSQIKKSYWSANTTASFIVLIANPQEGEVNLSLSSGVTANVSSGKYVYDVFITNTLDSTRSKVLEGIIYVEPSATKK